MRFRLDLLGLSAATLLAAIAPTLPITAQTPPVAEETDRSEEAESIAPVTFTGRLDENSQVLDDGSYYNIHTFEGVAGQAIVINMTSDDFDTFLILRDFDGEAIAQNDDRDTTNSQIVLTLTATGTYTIVANSYAAAQTGSYTLSIRTATAAELTRYIALVEADRLISQANQQMETSEYQAALQLSEQALTIYQEQGDSSGKAATLNLLGILHDFLSEYHQAIEYYQQALPLYQAVGSRNGEAVVLLNLGNAYNSLSEYDQAIEHYQQVLPLYQAEGDRDGEAKAFNNLGNAYNSLSEYQQAIEYYQQALPIFQVVENHNGEAKAFNNLGSAYYSLNQYQQAIDYFQQALPLFQALDNRDGEAQVLMNLGTVYHDLKQSSQAIEYLQQALPLLRAIGNRNGEARTLNNLGSVYGDLKQYSQALEYFQQALPIFQAIEDRTGEALTLGNLGAVYGNSSQYQQAIEYYQQALPIFRAVGDRAGEGTLLANIGKLLREQNQPELAIAFYKQSVNIRESIRADIQGLDRSLQQSYTDSVANDYRQLADLLLQQNRILEAQQVLDLLKVQELDDFLRGVQRNAQTEAGVSLRPAEQAALQLFETQQDQLVALGQELKELEDVSVGDRTSQQTARITQLRELQMAQRQRFREFFESEQVAAIVTQLRQTTGAANLELDELNDLRDNLRRLNENAVVLYPLVLDDRLELILVTADAPPIRRTANVSREELNRAIATFRSALQSPRSDAVTPARQLYDWLIRPIEADLAQAEADTIIYAPDSQLRYIPLAALHDGDQWLVQRFRVNNITAASLDDLDNTPTSGDLSVLAAAFTEGEHDVTVGDRTLSFAGLEFAEQEVAELAALMPQTVERLNDAFNPAIVTEMNDYRIVHLATHAAFNPGPPEDSFIVFGDGETANLTQIKDWSFPNVDLIVLSACETAVGDVPLGNGEEILGFGYLMQSAGADAAIASLWSVSDGGTQVLMDAFYTALSHGYSKTEALQRAQLALITGDRAIASQSRGASVTAVSLETGLSIQVSNNLHHPYYWAPFILIGNGL